MSIFHERLKQLKESCGETQQKIAEALEITPQAFSYYINGREPNFELLMKISVYFGVSVDYLIGTSNTKKTEYSDISEKLNLSEDSIVAIQKCNDDKFLVDLFLSNKFFFQLMRNFTTYVLFDDKSFVEMLKSVPKEFTTNASENFDIFDFLNKSPITSICKENAIADVTNLLGSARAIYKFNNRSQNEN